MTEENGKTSIKQLIQKMAGDGAEVLQGAVISVSPLRIQIKNDAKLIIGANITYVPWHLTDYRTELSFDDPAVRNNVSVGHHIPELHATLTEHPDTISETSRDVVLKGQISFAEKVKHKITVYNALKAGDVVHVLCFNHGKQYFVLDRVAV